MRHHKLGRSIVIAAWTLVVSLIATLPPALPASAAPPERPARLIRTFDLNDLSISNPGGIAYSKVSGSFQVLEATGGVADASLKEVTPHELPKGVSRIAARVTDPVNVTFDDVFGRLLIYTSPSDQLLAVSADAAGNLDPASMTRTNAKLFGITSPKGMAVDPSTGDLLVLDTAGPRIVRVIPDASGSFDGATVSEIDLGGAGLSGPTSLAIDPSTGHLFVASTSAPSLYELSPGGDLITIWDVSEAELVSPGGMVFAASGDLTDNPSQLSLYITDTGVSGGTATLLSRMLTASTSDSAGSLRTAAAPAPAEGQIAEVSLVQPQATAAAVEAPFTSTLINTIQSNAWNPPSPDTSGVVYLPATNTLMAVDGEVNEMNIYAGANVYESTLGGNLLDTWTTLDFNNNEPTGVSVDPSDGTLYISRDTPPKEIWVWDPGSNGTYETSDNIYSFVTANFGATDPEGVSYAVGLNRLFIADGLNNEIYQLAPGNNGVFDGVSPQGDDVVVDHFDILAMGMEDPEGVAYNPATGTLYIAGKTRNIGSYNFDTLLEVTTSGSLVRTIDVSDINPGRQYPKQKLSGLGIGPSSQNPSQTVLYIADRGEDNNNDPNENDGHIFEVTLPPGGGPVNNPPVANDDTASTPQGTQVSIDVAANDSDPDGNLDLSSVSTISGPSHGSTADQNDGTIDYTPSGSYTGPDQFTYEICDTDNACDTAVVDVTVTVANDPPTANDDTANTNEDTSVNIDVAANDTDPQGNGTLDLTSVTTISGPSNGSTVDNNDGTIDYTPDPDFNGPDQFTYRICDNLGLCDTANVDVTVDPVPDPPTANPDSATTPADTTVNINVAGNDSDPDGDLVLSSVSTVSGPSNGSTVDNNNGTIDYTPAGGYTGPDQFTYEICDTTPQCDQAVVSVTVSGDQIIYVTSTSGGNVGGVSFKDEDILAYDTATQGWSMYFDGSDVGLGTGGQELDGFHLDSDGSILLTVGNSTSLPGVGTVDDHDIVRFIPSSTGPNTAGTYQMYFNGENYGLTTNGEDIDAFGFAPNGNLVISTRGSYSVPGVSGKDVDLIAFNMATSQWSLYMDGVSVGLDGGNTEDVTATTIDSSGVVYLSVRSSFTVPGLSGDYSDIFACTPQNSGPITSCTFEMFWDGSAEGFGGEALNGMSISGSGGGGPVNNPPVANDDTAVTPQGTPVNIDVTANDSDPDGNLDPGSVNTISGPSNGSTVDNTDGTIDYTPTGSYIGPDQFTYEICDTDGECDTAVVDVTVTLPNDPPTANDDTANTNEDTAVNIDVAANDSDPDGNLDISSVSTVSGPSNGSTVDNTDGTIDYTPSSNFNGSDSFTYEICDTLGLCDTAVVDVTVDPVNDPPVANDDTASTSMDTAVIVNVASNDSDIDGNLNAASAAPTSSPPNGSAVGNGDGTITYTPDAGFTGSDSFTYQICDTVGSCDSATVNVNVVGSGGAQIIYLSSTSGGSIGGVSFKDEDVLTYDTSTGTWAMFFDGSDVGLGASGQEVDAFHLNADGSMLFSLGVAGTLPNVGSVDDHDIVKFIPTSTGDNTAGTYEMYFNGEDHDLAASGEDIDAIGFAPNGDLVVSLRGSYSVPGISGGDVDLLRFDGANWSLYLDGVAIGLDGGNTEDVTAAWIDSSGVVHLSVRSSFTVPGLSGDSSDIFACTPQNSGPITSCTFEMFWDGSANGFGSEAVNGLFIGS